MAVRTKRYQSRGGNKVRAIKVTERNYNDLPAWLDRNSKNLKAAPVAVVNISETGDESNHRIRLHIAGKGIRVVRVGDYVFHVLNDDLSLSDPNLYILKGDDFESKYAEIKG